MSKEIDEDYMLNDQVQFVEDVRLMLHDRKGCVSTIADPGLTLIFLNEIHLN